jgi:hypothetical protein
MDPVTIGIFVVCGLLVGGAIALRRPKAKPLSPKVDADAAQDAPDIELKIPPVPPVTEDDDRDLS